MFLGNKKVDDSLLVSETSLVLIPKDKFQLDTWSMFDEFMIYAADLFTATFANLMQAGYIRVLGEDSKSVKLFGRLFPQKRRFLVQLAKEPESGYLIGWLEEKIMEQLRFSHHNQLNKVIYDTLRIIFEDNHELANPGKVLVLEIIRHQRLHLYEFHLKKTWISNSVELWYNKSNGGVFKPRIYKMEDFVLREMKLSVLRSIVDSQLKKFISSD